MENEVDITNDGWPVAQPRFTSRPREDDQPLAVREDEVIDLRLDVLLLDLGVLLEPRDLDLPSRSAPMLQRIASSFIAMHMLGPDDIVAAVAMTKMSPTGRRSLEVISPRSPSIAACSAQIGSISVLITRAPRPRAAPAHPCRKRSP